MKRAHVAPICAALAAAGAVGATPASADHGGGSRVEAQTRANCSNGTRISERLRAADGRIRIDVELEHRHQRGAWTLVVLHERRVVARATLSSNTTTSSLELRRTVADWFGSDTVVTRASGPAGEQCRVTATV
jgi:hypothetical protein